MPDPEDDISQGGFDATDHDNPQGGGFDDDDEVYTYIYML